MKAYNLHQVNDLRYEEVQKPKLETGWALIEVMAAGVCGSDIPRIYQTGTYHFPTIPGHEFSGIVREVFDEENKFLIGKRVGVFPLIPCQKCVNCKQEYYEMCSNYNYLGSRTDGGFAEYVKVPVWNLIELPEEVSYQEAAMLEPMSVGLHALRQLPLKEVRSITILGLGPIGLMMAQWARILGIKEILLIGNKEEQLKLARETGFEKVCNLKLQSAKNWISEQSGQNGTDVLVDCVGSNEVLEICLESVRAKGHILIVGNPRNDLNISKNIFWKVHRKQLHLYGTWNSSYKTTDETKDDWKYAVQILKDGRMKVKKLITHKLPFEQLESGLEIMRDKKEFYCKVMTVREDL